MINHILLPIDLSEPPETLIRNAASLSKKNNAKLSLLHVFNLPQPVSMNSPEAGTISVQPYDHYLDSELMEEEKKIIDENAKKVTKIVPELNDIEIEVITSLGLIVEEISDYANKHAVDLIIMETSGASGFKEIFIGTHSEETTRKAPCPVLILPDNYDRLTIQNVCIAVGNGIKDFNQKLTVLKDMAYAYNANIHVIHIEEKPEKIIQNEQLERALIDALAGFDFTFTIIENEDVEKGIDKFTKDNRIDLLTLLYHKQNLFNRLLKKSVTTNFAYHSDIPLLVLK